MVHWYITDILYIVFGYLFALHFNILNKTEINERKPCFASLFFVPLHHIQDVMRVWAAAQQISSKLGSAFALHHTWIVKREEDARRARDRLIPL